MGPLPDPSIEHRRVSCPAGEIAPQSRRLRRCRRVSINQCLGEGHKQQNESCMTSRLVARPDSRQRHPGDKIELLSAQGAHPSALWEVDGDVQRVYDNFIRGYVYDLAATQDSVRLPGHGGHSGDQGLGVVHRCLVFQICLVEDLSRPFVLQLKCTDSAQNKRDVTLSAAVLQVCRDFSHIRFPVEGIPRGVWLNLCLDVGRILSDAFSQTMASVDQILVYSFCKLRRVFATRTVPGYAEQSASGIAFQALEPSRGQFHVPFQNGVTPSDSNVVRSTQALPEPRIPRAAMMRSPRSAEGRALLFADAHSPWSQAPWRSPSPSSSSKALPAPGAPYVDDFGYEAMVRRTSRAPPEERVRFGSDCSPRTPCSPAEAAALPMADFGKRDRSADSTFRGDRTRKLPTSKAALEQPVTSRDSRRARGVRRTDHPANCAQARTNSASEAGGRRLPAMAMKDRGHSMTPRAPPPRAQPQVLPASANRNSTPVAEDGLAHVRDKEPTSASSVPRLPSHGRHHPMVMRTQKIANIYGVALPASKQGLPQQQAPPATCQPMQVASPPAPPARPSDPCPFPGLQPLVNMANVGSPDGFTENFNVFNAIKATIRHQHAGSDLDGEADALSPGQLDDPAGATAASAALVPPLGTLMEVDNKVRRPSRGEEERRIKSYSPPPHRRAHGRRPDSLNCQASPQAAGPSSAPAASELPSTSVVISSGEGLSALFAKDTPAPSGSNHSPWQEPP
mmetsp:Transcript_64887/g.120729  ORF Transcript_64887/g.120729 Transcript_64887/m.120729 type:complete len:736 (-) Transcript_64887:152-2359(-)